MNNNGDVGLRILLVAATASEADILKKIPGSIYANSSFFFEKFELIPVITGVGSVATAWALTKWISSNPKPDLAINIGIAGSYKEEFRIGEVVIPVSDCFADAGIETGSGFMTLGEAGIEDPDNFPFRKGLLISENRFVSAGTKFIKSVRAITVNTATGSKEAIIRLTRKYDPDIETMEGAAFFYICSREAVPFLALRSVSNKVEPRNRDKWNIALALENLQEKLIKVLLSF